MNLLHFDRARLFKRTKKKYFDNLKEHIEVIIVKAFVKFCCFT